MLRICSSQYLFYEGKYIENTFKFFQYPNYFKQNMKMNAYISKTKTKQYITQNTTTSITNTIKQNLSKVNIKFVTAQSKVITTINLKQEFTKQTTKMSPKCTQRKHLRI